MTIKEIKQTAFAKRLLSQSQIDAKFHIWECLISGPVDNMAWELLEATRGTKEIYGRDVEKAISEMLMTLKAA
jgi:hypothetical protein